MIPFSSVQLLAANVCFSVPLSHLTYALVSFFLPLISHILSLLSSISILLVWVFPLPLSSFGMSHFLSLRVFILFYVRAHTPELLLLVSYVCRLKSYFFLLHSDI